MNLLQWISDHFTWVIFLAAILETIACLRVFYYNDRYLERVRKWFESDIIRGRGPGKASATLGTLEQLEHSLKNFRAEYIEQISGWDEETLAAKSVELSTRESLRSHSYGEWNRAIFNTSRDAIPMFPLLGILGTVFAIGCQLSVGNGTDGAVVIAESVTKNFGTAVWTTVWGIVFGIFFTLFNAFLIEPKTIRALEIERAAGDSLDDVLQLIARERQVRGKEN